MKNCRLVLACGVLVSYIWTASFAQKAQPEQIHLSFGEVPSELIVTWNTQNATSESDQPTVMYGFAGQWNYSYGTTKKFVDGGSLQHTQYIHHVKLTNLKLDTVYYYQCGGEEGWSEIFHFHTLPAGNNYPVSFAIYGDLGLLNGKSIPSLQNDVQNHLYDAILHVGDFAYDMDTNNGTVGDEFMKLIQPVAAYTPYMTCPGNHEEAYNFSNYKNRFIMPGDESSVNMFYSVNIGPVHLISYSTEYYFFLRYGIVQILRQYEWLEKDLKEANKPENRAKQPWIIAMGHRPMYCSNEDDDDCTKFESIVRTGIPLLHILGLENIFYKHGVDIILEAHEHSYERLWPVYNKKVLNGSYENPYTNPRAPIHIVTGSAGCQEDHDPFEKKVQAWSAFRNNDYGYSRMVVYNHTHLFVEQVSVDKGNQVVDQILVIKDKHGSYE